MNYNIETGAIENIICLPIFSRIINCDVNEDVNVPEGFADVRRVLALKENIISPAKYVGAKAVDMSGSVDYTVVYLGADGNIYSLPFNAEYSFSLPIENAEKTDLSDGVNVICSITQESENVRISSPRRLQIRAGLRASALCFGKGVLSEEIDGAEDEGAIQRLELKSECAFFDCESSDIVTLVDEYLLSEGDRIVYSDADVFVNEVRIDGEIVRISGETQVKLILQNGDDFETVLRRIPFDAETDLEELELGEADVLCRAYGSVSELDVSVSEGRAKIEVGIALDVCMAQNRNVAYTRDIYSTKQHCKAEYKKCSLPSVLLNKNVSVTQSERMAVSEFNFPAGADVIDVWGRGVCESASLENRRYVLRGKVKYKMICKRDGDFSICECELPFKYEAELGELDVAFAIANIKVMNPKVRCDGENLLIESELAISASAYGASEFDALSKATFGEKIEQSKNQFVLCFKSSDESNFELAKRYCVPFEKISDEAQKESFVIIER